MPSHGPMVARYSCKEWAWPGHTLKKTWAQLEKKRYMAYDQSRLDFDIAFESQYSFRVILPAGPVHSSLALNFLGSLAYNTFHLFTGYSGTGSFCRHFKNLLSSQVNF